LCYKTKSTVFIPNKQDIVWLCLSYFLLRLIFYYFAELKAPFFIYPSGQWVALFLNNGFFNGQEWIYTQQGMITIFDSQCSGTTFFCLILSYLFMRYKAKNLTIYWLLICYPLALITNASRILCSIYIYQYGQSLSQEIHEYLHLFIGLILFLFTFIGLILVLDRQQWSASFE